MSDLYDSLEDESDEKDTSPDYLNDCKAVALDFSRKTTGSPFYLRKKGVEEKPSLVRSFQYDREGLENKNFLPEIEKAPKGNIFGSSPRCPTDQINKSGIFLEWNPTSNIIVDKEALKEQGLQINKDGSFTKSPRAFAEELPFITREYRNLQFQRRKICRISRNMPHAKIHKKNIFSFTKNPVDGSINENISARQGSNEEILTSSDSMSSRLASRPKDKELLAHDNLTDSMKEKLLGQSGNPSETLKKTKRVMNLLEDRKGPQQVKGSKWQFQKTNAERKQNSFCGVSNKKKSKAFNPVISKQASDLVLNRPSLSYSERRQLESGFNPLHLRQGGKKVLSDTSRSNFGDSTVERLSEISSRVLSSENLLDEDEELFYRELMKKDKSHKPIQKSSRSEGPEEFPKIKNSVDSGSLKEQKQVRHNSSRFKPITKSMSIDLPSETVGGIQTSKKHTHYCSATSSSNMSKFELALKGKTYGYLANARNIFKMKAQSEGKLGVKLENSELAEENSDSEKEGKDVPKKSTPSASVLPEIQRKLPSTFVKAFKAKKPCCKVKGGETSKYGLQGFALPRVIGAENRDNKIQMEILSRISSCLNSPNGSSTVK